MSEPEDPVGDERELEAEEASRLLDEIESELEAIGRAIARMGETPAPAPESGAGPAAERDDPIDEVGD